MLSRAARQVLTRLCSTPGGVYEAIEGMHLGIQRAALHSTCQMYSQAETPTQTTPPPPPPQPPSPPSGLAAVPPVAKILGFAGAIPFLALTPQLVHSIPLLPDAWVANAGLLQIGYGVSIASFLGGIHWALAMAEYGGPTLSRLIAHDRYLWSVSPCLLAWPAVVMPQGPAALVVGGTLVACFLVDRRWARMGAVPPWYMSLRAPLTAAAVTGMGLTLFAHGMA